MTQVAAAQEMRISFMSSCPRCGHEQTQWYSRLALLTLLGRARPVDGYCVVCQENWQLSPPERHSLAAKLSG
jgi:hypothetical protein